MARRLTLSCGPPIRILPPTRYRAASRRPANPPHPAALPILPTDCSRLITPIIPHSRISCVRFGAGNEKNFKSRYLPTSPAGRRRRGEYIFPPAATPRIKGLRKSHPRRNDRSPGIFVFGDGQSVCRSCLWYPVSPRKPRRRIRTPPLAGIYVRFLLYRGFHVE